MTNFFIFAVFSQLLKTTLSSDYCEDYFSFTSGYEGLRLVANSAMAYDSGDQVLYSQGSSYITATYSNFARQKYRLRTVTTDYTYTDTTNVYSSGFVTVDEDTGQITASTSSAYTAQIYIQFCCVLESYYVYVLRDCTTGSTRIDVECCDCSISTITMTAPASFPGDSTFQFTIDGVGTAPTFNFDHFTVSNSNCPITAYKIMDSSNTDMTGSGWTVTNTGSNIQVTLPSSAANTIQTYNLKIKVTADGSHEQIEDITFNVECTGATNTILVTSTYTNILTSTQNVLVGTSTNKFELPAIQNSNAICASTSSITLSSSGTSNTSFQQLNTPIFENSEWVVKPSDQSQDDITYSFKITVNDNLGNSVSDPTIFTLYVGCPSEAQPSIALILSSQTFTLTLGQSSIAPFGILQYSSFSQGSFTSCQVQPTFNSIQITSFTDTVDNGDTQPTITQQITNTCIASDCGHLTLSSASFLYSLQFLVEYEIGGASGNTVSTIQSPIHSLTTQCNSQNTILIPETNITTELVVSQTLQSTFHISEFSCEYNDCCTFDASAYSIDYLSKIPSYVDPITCCATQLSQSGSTVVTFQVNRDVVASIIFRIIATSQQGQQAQTSDIQFDIVKQEEIDVFIPIYPEIITNQTRDLSVQCAPLGINFQKLIAQQEFEYKCNLSELTNSSINNLNLVSGLTDKYMNIDIKLGQISIDRSQINKEDIGLKIVSLNFKDEQQIDYKLQVAIVIFELKSQGIDEKKDIKESISNPMVEISSQHKNISAQIEKINQLGLVTIEFNQSMRTEGLNLSLINRTVLEIYIDSAENWHTITQFNMSKLNFTWNVTQFYDTMMEIQLNFSDPFCISPLKLQDKLIVHLKNSSYINLFMSKENNQPWHPDWWTIQNRIPKQMKVSLANLTFQDGSKTLNNFLIVLMVFSAIIFLVTSMGQQKRFMFIMVRSMQLIVHLPIFQIMFPANAILILGLTVPIMSFDILDQFDIWEFFSFIEFESARHNSVKDVIYNQIADIGYDSFNDLLLLQTLAFVFLWLFLLIVILVVVYIYAKLTNNEKANRYVQRQVKLLFFGAFIELFIQGYFEFLISGYLTQMLGEYNTNGEVISQIVSYITLAIAIIILPTALINIIFINGSRLQEEKFLDRWGQLYSNLDHKNRSKDKNARAYYFIFVLRRNIFVIFGLFIQDHLILQLLVILYMQILIMIYQGVVKPGLDQITNRLDLFNEFMVLICMQTMLIFSDWVPSPEVQFKMGWYWIGIFLIALLINLVIILYFTAHQIKLVCIKYYRVLSNAQQISHKDVQDNGCTNTQTKDSQKKSKTIQNEPREQTNNQRLKVTTLSAEENQITDQFGNDQDQVTIKDQQSGFKKQSISYKEPKFKNRLEQLHSAANFQGYFINEQMSLHGETSFFEINQQRNRLNKTQLSNNLPEQDNKSIKSSVNPYNPQNQSKQISKEVISRIDSQNKNQLRDINIQNFKRIDQILNQKRNNKMSQTNTPDESNQIQRLKQLNNDVSIKIKGLNLLGNKNRRKMPNQINSIIIEEAPQTTQ